MVCQSNNAVQIVKYLVQTFIIQRSAINQTFVIYNLSSKTLNESVLIPKKFKEKLINYICIIDHCFKILIEIRHVILDALLRCFTRLRTDSGSFFENVIEFNFSRKYLTAAMDDFKS